MAGTASHVTIDHDEIRAWVEARGGRPAVVERTHDRAGSGLLRIDHPGDSGGASLEVIGWDEFFRIFEDSQLAFVCSDDPGSRFAKIIAREE